MVAPIPGARPIHWLTGPASAVANRLSAPRPKTRITSAVSHGEMPKRLAALTRGASVSAITAAANTGSRMARPIKKGPEQQEEYTDVRGHTG